MEFIIKSIVRYYLVHLKLPTVQFQRLIEGKATFEEKKMNVDILFILVTINLIQ